MLASLVVLGTAWVAALRSVSLGWGLPLLPGSGGARGAERSYGQGLPRSPTTRCAREVTVGDREAGGRVLQSRTCPEGLPAIWKVRLGLRGSTRQVGSKSFLYWQGLDRYVCFRPEADLFPRPRAFGASQTPPAASPACGELEMCDAAM